MSVRRFEYTKVVGEENISFGKNVILDDFVFIYGCVPSSIGSYVHIASFTSISGEGGFDIGDYCALSSGCRLFSSTDDFKGAGFGNSCIDSSFRNLDVRKVTLEKFSIIGANSVILPGVTIGEGASVGAGSTVTRNLEAWGIYIGNTKVGERDREGVLETYERFRSASERDRLGRLLK